MNDSTVQVRWREHPHLDHTSTLSEIIESFAFAKRGQITAAQAVVEREMMKGIISTETNAKEQRFCNILLEEKFVTIRQLAEAAVVKSLLRMQNAVLVGGDNVVEQLPK